MNNNVIELDAAPCSIESEIGVLGGTILDPDTMPTAIDALTAEMFFNPVHGDIFRALLALDASGRGIRPVTIIEQMKHDKTYKADINQTLIAIVERIHSAAGVEDYCRIVKEKYILRRVMAIAGKMERSAREEGTDPSELLDQAEASLFEVSSQGFVGQGFRHIGEIIRSEMSSVEHILKTKERRIGIPTQFTTFNKMTGGFHGGELIIVAGRPGSGKTAIALNIAQHLGVDQYRPVGFFSLEMSNEQLLTRFIAAEAKVNAQSLREGRMAKRDFPAIEAAIKLIADTPIYVEDTGGLSLKDLRAMARQMKARHAIEVIIIDYLQLMSVPRGKTIQNREQEIAKISMSLKALAKELNIPIIALSQLSRQVEYRENRRPRLSDLRESGALEQDCDVALLLNRPAIYSEDGDKKGYAELIIGKQRNGPTGSVHLAFIERQTLFCELPNMNFAPEPEEPERSLFNGEK